MCLGFDGSISGYAPCEICQSVKRRLGLIPGLSVEQGRLIICRCGKLEFSSALPEVFRRAFESLLNHRGQLISWRGERRQW